MRCCVRRFIKGLSLCLAVALVLSLDACSAEENEPVQPSATVPVTEESPEPTPVPTLPPAALELRGGNELDWPCGVPFEEPGFSALDSTGADRSADVAVEGEIVCWKTGEYTLSYSFTDEKDGLVSATRAVNVVPVELPEETPTEKVIYLTFDDGPCSNTQHILELLAKYDAKATFFIIAQENSYSHLIPEIEAQGHSVGVHCNYHSYADIYASEEAYFNDFMKAQEFCYQYLGHYADISRFPGGATTAATYFARTVEGGFEQVEQRLRDMGVRYFDWDIQESETTTLDTYYIFRNNVPKFQHPVMLQHDARDYSIAALEDMLIWGTENGYEFRAITDSTPQRAYIKPVAYA